MQEMVGSSSRVYCIFAAVGQRITVSGFFSGFSLGSVFAEKIEFS